MSKISRRLVVLAVLVAVLALVFSVPTTQAATLTSGNYTYVVGGEETVFPFDPIVKKDGFLLPVDVFTSLGITVDNPQKKSMSITRDKVTVNVTLGQPWVTLQDGTQINVAPVPMRVSGRVFLPVQILAELSIDVQTDSSIITLRDLGSALTGVSGYPDPTTFATAKQNATLTGVVKSTEGPYLNIDVTYLTPALAASPALVADAGTRSRLVRMLDTNTLLLVHLKNTYGGNRGLTFNPSTLYIFDNTGMQYEYAGTTIDVQGSISTKVAPTVDKYGILAFQKVSINASSLSYYLDSNPGLLQTLTLPVKQ